MTDMLGPYILGPDGPNVGIYQGDARELAKAIPDESVDLVFTDPPYDKKSLILYDWLARAAKRILKSDGFLLVMIGNYWKDRVMNMLTRNLDYFWDYHIDLRGGGRNSIIWPRRTIVHVKSILAYRPGQGMPRCNVIDLWGTHKADKRYHVWGQDESSARYYIDCFTCPGQIVFDPFAGGGTTAVVARNIGRRWLAFEIDPDTTKVAHERMCNTSLPLPLVMPEQQEMLLEPR